ncbi:MAG: Rieske (2Fe-2S) protein [Promicromonosporaceae bacterium]|nr:Rieske (2Fe-2S) protein [Promicromonosporaceae bacterium]
MTDLTRRQLLGVAGTTVAGVCLLSACVTPAETPDEAASAVAAQGKGTKVAALADVQVGAAKAVTLDGKALLLTRPAEREVHLFSSICPHAGCQVAPANGELDCPCHGSRFALKDGSVISGPAQSPLAEIPVQIQGNDVVLAG